MPTYDLKIRAIGEDKNASATLSKIKGGLGGLAKSAALGVAGLGVATAGIGAALGKLAMDAAPLQGIKAAFEGIAEASGRGMDETLRALQAGSLGMVSQRDLMATYNTAAQLVSDTFANQLPDAMGYLSKVSAATGQDMGFMLDSLVRGVGRLSPLILDNLGIQVALSEATDRASKEFGIQADQLSKSQIQAGMMSVVLEKLAKNTAAMPDITENASTKMAQMRAQMKDVKDQIGTALLPMFTKLMGGFADLASKYAPMLIGFFENNLVPFIERNVIPAFEELFNWLGTALPRAFELVSEAVGVLSAFWESTLQPILETTWQFIQNNIIPILTELVAWLMTNIPAAIQAASDFFNNVLLPAIQSILSWLEENGPKIVETLENAFTTILEVVGPIVTEIVTFVSEEFQVIIDWVKENWPLIQETVSDVLGTIKTIVETVLGAISDFWSSHGDAVIALVTNAWETIKTIVDTAIKIVLGIIQTIMQLISGDWEGAWETIKSVASTIWDAIKELVSTAIDNVKIVIGEVLDVISENWETVWDAIREIIHAAWDAILSIVEAALKGVRNLIMFLMKSVKEKFVDAWEAIKGIFTDAWEAIKGFVQSGADAIKNILNTLAEGMKNVGKAIVDNLKAGIEGAWEGLKSWFSDRLNDLTSLLPFSEPDDPRSPLYGLSKAGEAIGENILKGLKVSMPKVQAEMMGGLALAGAGAGGQTNINYNFDLNANYAWRERDDLAADVRLLNLLYSG